MVESPQFDKQMFHEQKQYDFSGLSDLDKQKVEALKKEFEVIKAGKYYIGKQAEVLEIKLLKEGDPQDNEYRELAEKIKRLQEETSNLGERGEKTKEELSKLLQEVQSQIKTLSDREIQILSQISNKDFLSIPKEKRLQYIIRNCIDSEDVSKGKIKKLDFTFTFGGKFNRDLYLKTTAGQVLPKEVGTVSIGGEIYYRDNIMGEFFTKDNRRLLIHEGTRIEIGELRTADELENIAQNNENKLNEYIKGNPGVNQDIVLEAVNRGIDPKFASLYFSDLIKDLPEEQAKVTLEDAFCEFDRVRGQFESSKELQKGQYEENFILLLLKRLFNDIFGEKALVFGIKEERIKEFKKVSETKIDFSLVEKGDIQNNIEQTRTNLGISSKLIDSILKQESKLNFEATRFEEHIYYRELKKGISHDEAKLLATSFGGFQIMGFNYKVCGYNSVFDFVEAMKNPKNQFNAFEKFVLSNNKLHTAMKGNNPDFQTIAYYYNGPLYPKNDYDNKIKKYFYA